MAIVGHVDRRMLDRYGHIKMQAKRTAIEFLLGHNIVSQEEKKGSYVTIHVTKSSKIPVYSDLSIDSIGKERIGSCGFEPQTPTVSR
jgi:hypothetical protein